MTLDEMLADQGRTMGRRCTLEGHATVESEPPVHTLVYRVHPAETDVWMRQPYLRFAVYIGGHAASSGGV